MSVIHLNMINIIKVTLEEQRVNPQLPTNNIQQQDTMQHSNITQYISQSTPLNTQPISQLTESPTSTEPITNKRQQTAKRKQTDPPDSEEEVNTSEVANNSDMIMEDQTISIPNQTRTTTRFSAPVIRDNKKKSQLTTKRPCLDWARHENEVR